MMDLFWYLGRFVILSLFLNFMPLQSILAGQANPWYAHEYLLDIPGLSHVRVTTTIKLNGEDNGHFKALPAPTEKLDSTKKHYVFFPGRGDYAEKLTDFINMIQRQEKDAYVWCVDPYGQGGSGGSVPCEHYDPNNSQPCCPRRGDGTWDAYTKALALSVDAIYSFLKESSGQSPHPVGVVHSMSGNILMSALLNPTYKEILNRMEAIHFVAPMVNFSLELGYRGWREEAVRKVLYGTTWSLSKMGYGQKFMPIGSGPINSFKLKPSDVYDKVYPQKAEAFIQICQLYHLLEIGKASNEWFYQAVDACSAILGITRADFGKTNIFVHAPGNDQVVYPEWQQEFWKDLVDHDKFITYVGEPHNIFWGTDAGMKQLSSNILKKVINPQSKMVAEAVGEPQSFLRSAGWGAYIMAKDSEWVKDYFCCGAVNMGNNYTPLDKVLVS